MKELPIVLTTPDINAVMEGRKTQLRVLCPSPLETIAKGDVLWVQERWRVFRDCVYRDCGTAEWLNFYEFEAGKEKIGVPKDRDVNGLARLQNRFCGAKSMPRWMSRLTLEVASVWPHRLQDISEEDAAAEGFTSRNQEFAKITAKSEFIRHFQAVHGVKWGENPAVVAVRFLAHEGNVDEVLTGVNYAETC